MKANHILPTIFVAWVIVLSAGCASDKDSAESIDAGFHDAGGDGDASIDSGEMDSGSDSGDIDGGSDGGDSDSGDTDSDSGDTDSDSDDDDDDDDFDTDTNDDVDTETEVDTDTDTSDDGMLLWVKRAGGPEWDSAVDTAVWSDGSSFVTGFFAGQAVFGSGEPNETVLTTYGEDDVYVALYAPDGKLKWVQQAGGPQKDAGTGVTILKDGSLVVSGEFREEAVFGPGQATETRLVSSGLRDVFVAKYDWGGNLLWVRQAGGESHDMGHRVVPLPGAAVAVVGEFSESAVFGQGGPNETTLIAHNESKYEDIFIAKYDIKGDLIWVKQAGGEHHDYAHRAVSMPDGSILMTGQYEGIAVFGPGEPNETKLLDGLLWNLFVARYEPDGSLAWARPAGGEWIDAGYGITAWPDGSFAVTGSFEFEATFGAGEDHQAVLDATGDHRNHEIYVAKYDRDGHLMWAKPAGGSSADKGLSVAALKDGSVLVSGSFSYRATFGLGEPNEVTFRAGRCSIFYAQYQSDGAFSWARYAPGGG